ncbi:hypothetical protein OKW33_004426 [Paraburkholderia atlantica]|uniref:Uncharacterized protein n=1 Tax=Paraburkholderia atlantica TaxID=2654982 RepID=A0A7W8V3R5_PARAM|nr:hypothetical protein [Paraburkholderia atlantica]
MPAVDVGDAAQVGRAEALVDLQIEPLDEAVVAP